TAALELSSAANCRTAQRAATKAFSDKSCALSSMFVSPLAIKSFSIRGKQNEPPASTSSSRSRSRLSKQRDLTILPPSRTAVGFAPSSVATASGSALRTKKQLLSDVLLDSSPTLPFVPELDAVFCSGNFSASLPEAETWGGTDERRGES